MKIESLDKNSRNFSEEIHISANKLLSLTFLFLYLIITYGIISFFETYQSDKIYDNVIQINWFLIPFMIVFSLGLWNLKMVFKFDSSSNTVIIQYYVAKIKLYSKKLPISSVIGVFQYELDPKIGETQKPLPPIPKKSPFIYIYSKYEKPICLNLINPTTQKGISANIFNFNLNLWGISPIKKELEDYVERIHDLQKVINEKYLLVYITILMAGILVMFPSL